MPAKDDLSVYLEAAREAVRRGAAVLEDWRGRFRVNEKARADLVTDADLGSQKAVRSYLQNLFPSHAFLEEEGGGGEARPPSGSPPTWIVDPLDGTTNYVHDLPLYCVSIGLWIDDAMVVGAILDPRHNELFSAATGHGAWLNGTQRLKTSPTTRLEDALITTGFPPNLDGHEKSLEWWRHFSFRAQSLRRTGSTALNMAYLAAGRFDVFYAYENHPWDVAGGMVIVREAGGVITNTDGTLYDPFTPDALATNGPLHKKMCDELGGSPSR